MKRRITAAAAALLMLLCACGNPKLFTDEEKLTGTVSRSKDITQTYNYADGAQEPPTSYKNYISGMMDFSLRQLRQHSQDAKESFVFSPASAALQLGALANGASGDTRSEILLALTGTLGLDDLNACSSFFMSRLESVSRAGKKEAPAEQLTFGGALCIDKSADVKTSFLQAEKDFYGYDVFRYDYKGEHAADKLNSALSAYTSDSGIVFPEGSTVNAVSALALNDGWVEAAAESVKGTFNGTNGAQTADYFTSSAKLLHSDRADAVLKYTAANPLKLLIILPKDANAFDDYVSRFDAAELNKLLDSMDITKQSTAALPSFSVTTDKKAQPLSGTLTKCGLYTLFGKDASFSALSYSQSVKAGEMYELAPVFSLDRNGINTQTTAAAVQTEPAELTVDRPFVFLLLDNESNLPVLAGTVVNS